jgi:Na+-translocating ferredoxin:NAD+ oxidoreductase subunit C
MPVEAESKITGAWPEQIPELLAIPLPERLSVPIALGGGEANVKPLGFPVRRGDPLVQHAAESAHIPLAPADGTLGETRPIRLTTGKPASALELIVSHESQTNPQNPPTPGGEITNLVEGIERIRSGGVWANRHASPDLIGQLNHNLSRPVDTLICTILDSDAGLRLNALIAARHADQVARGVSLLAKITGARHTIVAIETYAPPQWINPIAEAANRAHLQLEELANEYPQSDPTLMVYSLTRRRLVPGNLPTTRGVMVVDAAAAMAIGYMLNNEPMLSVPVALHDHAKRHSHFLLVPVGTTIEHVLHYLRIPVEGSIVRGGDLLRDVSIRTDTVIAGSELTIHVTAPQRPVIPEPCIRCAWCIEACPTLIHPALILDAAQRHDMKMARRAGIAACIECGICSHVCPSRLPLLNAIREVRKSNSIDRR